MQRRPIKKAFEAHENKTHSHSAHSQINITPMVANTAHSAALVSRTIMYIKVAQYLWTRDCTWNCSCLTTRKHKRHLGPVNALLALQQPCTDLAEWNCSWTRQLRRIWEEMTLCVPCMQCTHCQKLVLEAVLLLLCAPYSTSSIRTAAKQSILQTQTTASSRRTAACRTYILGADTRHMGQT